MIKMMPFLHSSPPKASPAAQECGIGSKPATNPSTSSESEPDTVSIESSTEEAPSKDDMKPDDCRYNPALEFCPTLPTEINGKCTCAPEQKKHKKRVWKILNALACKVKSKGKVPQQEESKPVLADQIRELIQKKKLFEASHHLIAMEKESYGDFSGTSEQRMEAQSETEALYELLKRETLDIINASIHIAPTKPELLQNAVKAIVEQEKEDERAALERGPGNKGGSRPRKWKEVWRDTLEASVTERMKETPFAGHENLSTAAHSFLHLGRTMKEDLITVVQHIKPHYPKHFQVCSLYAECYHRLFSSHLEAIAQFELGDKDTYLLLTWVQNIYPNEIRTHPVLVKELSEASLGSLLPPEKTKELEMTYLLNEADSIKRWLASCLEIEVKRWTQAREPEKLDGHFHSELPIDAIQAIHGGQKRAEDITPDLGNRMSALVLTELLAFLQSYKMELEHFIRGNKPNRYFKATLIANINNCSSFGTYTEENPATAQDDVKAKVFSTLTEIQNTVFDVLLQGLFQELQPLFRKFTQKKWLSCTDVMDEILTTTCVHIAIFETLKQPFRQAIMGKIHLHLVQQHIARLMKRKAILKTPELQNNLSQLIQRNASALHAFCTENGSNATWLASALLSLAEIIKLQDKNAIKVEVSGLASRYPDLSKRHLAAILYIKGNLTSNESRSILSVLDIEMSNTLPTTSLFSTIRVS